MIALLLGFAPPLVPPQRGKQIQLSPKSGPRATHASLPKMKARGINTRMSDQTPKIRIRGLRKRFGAKRVLDGVDLDVPKGTSLVVIGGSGSGKSVLLKCILGLIEPDDGVIEIDGQDVLRLPRPERDAVRARIGMLFQNGALFDSLPVWENVAFGLLAQRRTTRAQARQQAGEFLSQVGLAP